MIACYKSEIIHLHDLQAASVFPINKIRKVKTKSPIYNDFASIIY